MISYSFWVKNKKKNRLEILSKIEFDNSTQQSNIYYQSNILEFYNFFKSKKLISWG